MILYKTVVEYIFYLIIKISLCDAGIQGINQLSFVVYKLKHKTQWKLIFILYSL